MAFTNSFNGKNTGIVLPSGAGVQRSQENMNNLILSAEKLKADTYKKNEEEFLKASNVDPVFVLANSARETQSKLLDTFNTTWGKKMRDKGGQLTTDDKVEMAKQKDYILMQQAKMQQDMEQAQLHNKMTMQNPNRWDAEEQQNRYNEYIKTGTYDHTEPPIKPLSLTDAAMKNINKVATKEYAPEDERKSYSVNGVPYYKQTTYSARKEDVIPYIKSAIADNDQYGAGVLKEWNELPAQEKESYHTKNPSNPILEMAVDKHWKEWVKSEEKDVKNSQGTGNKAGFSVFKGTGKDVTYTPTSARAVKLGTTDYSSFHDIPNIPVDDVTPQDKIRVLSPDGEEEMQPASNIPADLVGYDENTDELIFTAKSNFIDPTSRRPKGAGMRFALKRTEAGAKYDNIEIVKDGNKVKIGSLGSSTPTPSTSGDTWDKHKRK